MTGAPPPNPFMRRGEIERAAPDRASRRRTRADSADNLKSNIPQNARIFCTELFLMQF